MVGRLDYELVRGRRQTSVLSRIRGRTHYYDARHAETSAGQAATREVPVAPVAVGIEVVYCDRVSVVIQTTVSGGNEATPAWSGWIKGRPKKTKYSLRNCASLRAPSWACLLAPTSAVLCVGRQELGELPGASTGTTAGKRQDLERS